MNSAPLNGFVLNGASYNAVQRSVTLFDVVAQVTLNPRVWVRGLVANAFVASAQVLAKSSVRIRAVTQWAVEASSVYTLRNFTTSPVGWANQAEVTVQGEVFDRTLVSAPVVLNAVALTVFDGGIHVREPTTLAPTASIVAKETSYTRHRDVLNWPTQADIWLQFDILRRIPYDEDTVEERTILVPEDQRLVYVS